MSLYSVYIGDKIVKFPSFFQIVKSYTGYQYPDFKLLYLEGSELEDFDLGIKGIQRTALVNGSPQKPILVDQDFVVYPQPEDLPDDIENGDLWIQAKHVIKTLLGDGNVTKEGPGWRLTDLCSRHDRCKLFM